MIIDNSYLQKGSLAIPNNAVNANITGVTGTTTEVIDAYIAQYEEELLLHAIGLTNYETLSGIMTAGTLDDPGNEIWKELVDGKQYTYEGVTVKWYGLRETVGTIKKSLIANFVFCKYLADDSKNYTTSGIEKSKSKNSESYAPVLKITEVWREFIRMYQYGAVSSPRIITNSSGMTGVDWSTSELNVKRSLYQFLRDNDDFGDYNFTLYENMNSLQI